MSEHHYFATTGYGWRVADTRAKAIADCAKQAGGAKAIKQHMASKDPGLYVWSCRVDLPIDASYDISYYKPQGVPTAVPMESRIVNAKGHIIPND